METVTQHKFVRAFGFACIFLVGTTALSGCRDDEQGRIINYQPGVYKGKQDTPLSNKARAEARDRTYLQAGVVGMASGGSVPDRGDVRRPGRTSNLDHNALIQRLRAQGG